MLVHTLCIMHSQCVRRVPWTMFRDVFRVSKFDLRDRLNFSVYTLNYNPYIFEEAVRCIAGGQTG